MIQIHTIQLESFLSSHINEIYIQPCVLKICEGAFSSCRHLRICKQLKKKAFAETEIDEIYFPKSLIELEDGWCNRTSKLTKIRVDATNSKYDRFFQKCDIKMK